ncbi:MAG: YraN family protein [Roseburia sp.]|nr:YraN family protein [Roseburia sp.]
MGETKQNNRQLGAKKEEQAVEYLSARGFRVAERNFRCQSGEIDIIGYHDGYLVFVEVKYRSGASRGGALSAVDGRKQRRICRVADYYRYIHHCRASVMVRYDVVAIQGEEIIWIKNAFLHVCGRR